MKFKFNIKGSLLICVGILFSFFGVNAQVKGAYNSKSYKNDYFGVIYNIPKGAKILNDEQKRLSVKHDYGNLIKEESSIELALDVDGYNSFFQGCRGIITIEKTDERIAENIVREKIDSIKIEGMDQPLNFSKHKISGKTYATGWIYEPNKCSGSIQKLNVYIKDGYALIIYVDYGAYYLTSSDGRNALNNNDVENPFPGLDMGFYKGFSSVSSPSIDYVVQRGDTLYGIAKKYGVMIKKITIDNNLSNPNLISVNQTLKICF